MKWSLEQGEEQISLKEQTALLVFLDHCFTSMEVDLIRNQIQRLVSVRRKFIHFYLCFVIAAGNIQSKVKKVLRHSEPKIFGRLLKFSFYYVRNWVTLFSFRFCKNNMEATYCN